MIHTKYVSGFFNFNLLSKLKLGLLTKFHGKQSDNTLDKKGEIIHLTMLAGAEPLNYHVAHGN